MPSSALASRHSLMASRTFARASALGLALTYTPRDRRAFGNVHAVFIAINGDVEIHNMLQQHYTTELVAYPISTIFLVSRDSIAAWMTFWAARPSAPEPSISSGETPSATCFRKQ